MGLKLNSLKQAADQLQEAIEFSHSELAKNNDRLFKQFRNSVIQCFEFTYELCWKMLKRQLMLDAPTPAGIDELSFNDMMILPRFSRHVILISYEFTKEVLTHDKIGKKIYKRI